LIQWRSILGRHDTQCRATGDRGAVFHVPPSAEAKHDRRLLGLRSRPAITAGCGVAYPVVQNCTLTVGLSEVWDQKLC
jgi:hypothetical protein